MLYKFVMATAADTDVTAFKANHSVSVVNPVNMRYRLSGMFPDAKKCIFD
jgi:hypothetical protein